MFSYTPQSGEDLGEKMHNVFCQCFSEGFRSVVIIGSDSPDLPLRIVRDAFQALDTYDAVIGPAFDGGYYLIGFTRDGLFPDVFRGIAWGTNDVFRKTMKLLEDAGIRPWILPIWRDIDKPEDIFSLIEDNKNTDFANSRTMTYLKEFGIAKGT
jgi:rSAM/selenodomain-associated transferase 1